MTPSLAHASSASSFLRELRRDLMREVAGEMEFTMRVAVCAAAGMSRPQMVQITGGSDLEVKMALERLKRVAISW
jgi:hypothetical protein